MKIILATLFTITLCACSSTIPTNQEDISNQVIVERDDFKQQTWIRTPLYLSRQGFTDTFPVQLSFRSLYKGDKRAFIQLYVSSSNVDWGFYHSANGQDDYSFEFDEIDNEVSANTGMVTTEEVFGLIVPYTYLEKMASTDWKIKVYGKRNEGVFQVPASLSKAFLEKLNCYEQKTC